MADYSCIMPLNKTDCCKGNCCSLANHSPQFSIILTGLISQVMTCWGQTIMGDDIEGVDILGRTLLLSAIPPPHHNHQLPLFYLDWKLLPVNPLWNTLPCDLVSSSSCDVFKALFKFCIHLFHYYPVLVLFCFIIVNFIWLLCLLNLTTITSYLFLFRLVLFTCTQFLPLWLVHASFILFRLFSYRVTFILTQSYLVDP